MSCATRHNNPINELDNTDTSKLPEENKQIVDSGNLEDFHKEYLYENFDIEVYHKK